MGDGLFCWTHWQFTLAQVQNFLTVAFPDFPPILDGKRDSGKGRESACRFMKLYHSIINN